MKTNWIKYGISILIISNFAGWELNSQQENLFNNKAENKKILFSINHSDLRETLYTKKNCFLEVNLETQHAKIVFRDGIIKEFGVSTGNDKIFKGLKTREGLFVIQTKAKQWHSRQFDSTLMLNWMGFNYGIGFHALLGNTYYKYLGKKVSSHGCVRVSREDISEIYPLVEFDTPVLVHSGNAAITIGFTDEDEIYSHYSYEKLSHKLTQRLQVLYDGLYFLEPKEKLLIEKNISHDGLFIGDRKRIPNKQFRFSAVVKKEPAYPDKLKFNNFYFEEDFK